MDTDTEPMLGRMNRIRTHSLNEAEVLTEGRKLLKMYWMLEPDSLVDPVRARIRSMVAHSMLRNMSFDARETVRVLLYDAFVWDTGDAMDMELHERMSACAELGFGERNKWRD